MNEYAYMRDGSVLGRVTGWRGGVPIIDTTDRHPDSPLSGPLDSVASRSTGMPSEPFSEAPALAATPSLDGEGASRDPAAGHGGGVQPHTSAAVRG